MSAHPRQITFHIESPYTGYNGYPQVGRLTVGDEVVLEVGLDDSQTAMAEAQLRRFIESALPGTLPMATAIEKALKWSPLASLALAVGFNGGLSPYPQRVIGWTEGLKHPRTRGRPRAVDQLTRRAATLFDAWWAVTGSAPSPHRGTLFTKAVLAASNHMPLRNRRGDVVGAESQHLLLENERKKFLSGRLVAVPPKSSN